MQDRQMDSRAEGTSKSAREDHPLLQRMKTFYLTRDFYSNPEVLLVTAPDITVATELLNKRLASENFKPGQFGGLIELDTTKPNLTVLTPPGDRHFR